MNKPSPDSFLFFLFHLSPFPLTSFFLPVFPLALEPLPPARNKPHFTGIFLEPPQCIWLEWMRLSCVGGNHSAASSSKLGFWVPRLRQEQGKVKWVTAK